MPGAGLRSPLTPSPRTIVIAGLFAAVGLSYLGPISGYLSAKSGLRTQEETLARLQAERTQLAGQLAELKQPAILEIHAREIGMLRPGEQGFVIDFVGRKPATASVRVEMVPPRSPGAS
jgi:hypothetical protein